MPYADGRNPDNHSGEPTDLQGCFGIIFAMCLMAAAMAVFLYFVL
jgi:hypothetical protein